MSRSRVRIPFPAPTSLTSDVTRLARRKALSEGLAALETLYRDALAGADAPLRNLDRAPIEVDARACVRALDACREARDALEFNPNEGLLLEWLALHLPGVGGVPRR